jgi:hypothetical protein
MLPPDRCNVRIRTYIISLNQTIMGLKVKSNESTSLVLARMNRIIIGLKGKDV